MKVGAWRNATAAPVLALLLGLLLPGYALANAFSVFEAPSPLTEPLTFYYAGDLSAWSEPEPGAPIFVNGITLRRSISFNGPGNMSEDVYLVYRSSLGDATHDYGIRRTRSDSSASTSLPISIVDLSNGDIWAYAVSPDTLPVIPEPAYAGWIVGLAALGLLAMRRVRR